MKKIVIILGLILIVGTGLIGFHIHQRNTKALEYIILGDQHYRDGNYQEALTAYQHAHETKASSETQERIQLAEDALTAQKEAEHSRKTVETVESSSVVPQASDQSEPYEQAAEKIITWIREERFSEVEDLMLRLLKNKTRTRNGFLYADTILFVAFEDVDNAADISDLEPKLNRWIGQHPSNSIAYTIRASFYYGVGWKARGIDYASTVSDEDWKTMRKYMELAVHDAEMAYKLDSKNPLPAALMCSAARPFGFDDDTMERYFQRAIADNPDYYQVYWSKLMHLAPKWGGSMESMVAFAKQTAKNAPRGSALPGILTAAHEEIGWFIIKDAKRYYNIPEVWSEIERISMRLMEDFPHSGGWVSEYAVFAHHAGKLEEAQKYHDLALKLDPNAFEVRYERGRFFHYYKKNLHRALQEYTEALKLRPYSLKVLHRKASILFDRQQWLKALKAYSKLIEVEPHNAQNYYNRGSVHVRLRQYRQAIQDYTQSITLDPDDKLAYKWRAACYERLGMIEEQKKDLRMLESLSQ